MSQSIDHKIESLAVAAAGRLLPMIGSASPLNIQSLAVKILAKTHSPKIEERVIAFFTAHPDLEDSILAIAELPADTAVSILVARAHEKRAHNRDIIAEQLGRFKTPASFECLRDLLGDEDRHVRYQSANSLFALGGNEAALALCRYISDPDEWISMSILKLLCRMKEHESIPFLAEQFTKDPDIRRKAQMVSFLSMFRSVTLVNIFDEGLRGKDARLKANSIEAIGELELPQREIKQRIQPFLRDPNNRIRANAILALAKSEPEVIRPEIVQMVESSDTQLRRSAAYILGMISPVGNEILVEKLIVDASHDVRKRMVLSLKAFPRDFVQKQLEKSCVDQNKWIRKHSIEQAANFPEFPKALIIKQLKTETAYPNLVACMEFFGRHPDEEGARLIRQRVKDKREQVVSGVIRAIGAMFGLKGLQAIAPQVNYKDPKILRTFVVTHFGLGGLDILPSVLDKAAQIKGSALENPYLASIEGCFDLLNLKAKMPKELMAELSRLAAQEAAPPPAPTPRTVPLAPAAPTARPVMPTVPGTPAPTFAPPAAQPPAPTAAPTPSLFAPMPPPVQPVAAVPVPPAPEEPLEEGMPTSEEEAPTTAVAPRKAKPKMPAEFQAGVKFFNLGKYAKAKKAFNAAIEEHPDLIKAYLYLGLIAFEEKEYESGKDLLQRVLESDPGNRKANLVMVKIFKQLREWTNLVGVLERLIGSEFACDEENVKLAKELGSAYIFVRDFDKARAALEKVFQFDPTDPQSNYHLAMAYFHLQDFTKAEALLRDILRQVPKGNRLQVMAESLMEKIRQSLTAASGAEPPPATAPKAAAPTPPPEPEPEPEPEPGMPSGSSELPPLGIGDDLQLPGLENGGAPAAGSGAKPFLDLSELNLDALQPAAKPEAPGEEPLDLGGPLFPDEGLEKKPGGGADLSFLGEIPEPGGPGDEFPNITMPGTLDDLTPSDPLGLPLTKPTTTPRKDPAKKPDDEPPEDNGDGGFKLPSL